MIEPHFSGQPQYSPARISSGDPSPEPDTPALEFKSQPGHASTFTKQRALSCVGWGLEGTLANTEHPHRTICRAALQELSGRVVVEREFRIPHYRGAFGLPGAQTSARLALGLRNLDPERLGRARQHDQARGVPGVADVAGACHDTAT